MSRRILTGTEDAAYATTTVTEPGRSIAVISGHVDPKASEERSVEEQTVATLAELERVLKSLDVDHAAVLRYGCYLRDIADFDAFDRAYGSVLGENAPARTTVGVGLGPGVKVEIEALVELPAGQ